MKLSPFASAALFVALSAGGAAAHPGHVAEVADHTHWIALGATFGAAVLAAVLVKNRIGSRSERAKDEMKERAKGANRR